MKYVYWTAHTVLTLLVLVVVTACGPSSIEVRDHAITADISGLELQESEAPTILYTRPGAPGLGNYSRFVIDPVQVVYDDPKMKELSPEQVGEMQQYLRDAVIKELRDGGYEVGTRSQSETLRVSFTISGLKAPSAMGNVTAAVAAVSISVGEVTVEAIFREAVTNRIDAVAVTRTRGARMLNPKPWSTWADVENAFDNWAKGLRAAIDKAHAR